MQCLTDRKTLADKCKRIEAMAIEYYTCRYSDTDYSHKRYIIPHKLVPRIEADTCT